MEPAGHLTWTWGSGRNSKRKSFLKTVRRVVLGGRGKRKNMCTSLLGARKEA